MEMLHIYLEEQYCYKVLQDKTFSIGKIPKYDGYKRCLASVVYKFVDKRSASLADKSVPGKGVKSKIIPNQQLAENLHKSVIRKFKKGKVYSSFKDNIWGADRQLIIKFNNGFRLLLCVIDINSKHVWVVPVKDK